MAEQVPHKRPVNPGAIKREKSEAIDNLERIHLNTGGGFDESDGTGCVTEHDGLCCVELEGISGRADGILRKPTTDRIPPQIGPSPDESEVLESNIHIRHPLYASEAIPLGIHLRKHKRGFRVHRIISDGPMADQILKIGDVITSVVDVDTSSIELTELKKLFWDIDAEVTFTLEIIRLVGDETVSGTDPMYQELEIQVSLSVNNGDVKLTTVVEERSGTCCCYPPSESFDLLIWCKESNDEHFLCVEEDGTPKMKTLCDKNDSFYWKEQRCHGRDNTNRYILLNEGSCKTLVGDFQTSTDVTVTIDVKTDDKGFCEVGVCNWDQRMILKDPIENEDSKYIKSNANTDFYWTVGTEGRLQFTRNENERVKFFFEYGNQKGVRGRHPPSQNVRISKPYTKTQISPLSQYLCQ